VLDPEGILIYLIGGFKKKGKVFMKLQDVPPSVENIPSPLVENISLQLKNSSFSRAIHPGYRVLPVFDLGISYFKYAFLFY
jgi:hypothetical protein